MPMVRRGDHHGVDILSGEDFPKVVVGCAVFVLVPLVDHALGLVAAGVFAPPASIVEPLIAATIAFVALENLVFKDMTRWRPAIVFAFGLIHGMGFAGFFGSLGLPDGQFWSALIGFNIGVEIGQLSVVALAALIFWSLRSRLQEQTYRHLFVWPASLIIGAIGAYWAIERAFGL